MNHQSLHSHGVYIMNMFSKSILNGTAPERHRFNGDIVDTVPLTSYYLAREIENILRLRTFNKDRAGNT